MPKKKRHGNTSPAAPLALFFLALIVMLVQRCAAFRLHAPLPAALENEVRVPGFPDDVRAWADEPSKSLTKSALESIQEERIAYGEEILKKTVAFLALSGGGDNGAFGAGVLCGWTEHGDRHQHRGPHRPLRLAGLEVRRQSQSLYHGNSGGDLSPEGLVNCGVAGIPG
jgi:hypothetical protein